MYVCSSLVRFSLFWSPMKRKSDYKLTRVREASGVPSYVNKVKGHVVMLLEFKLKCFLFLGLF